MQKIYPHQCTGGKGNVGMFIERDPQVCAAGVPTAQKNRSVAECLRCYSLQDEVNSLIGDSIQPAPKPLKLPPLRHPRPRDNRYSGPFSEASELIRPPMQTKFQTLVEDLKTTIYSSYWKKRTGTLPDLTPSLPIGFDYVNSTLGQPTGGKPGHLYDVIMPRDPVPDKTPAAKKPAYQTDRNYCKPAYNADLTYGQCKHAYHPGKWMKTCLTDDRIPLGIRNQPLNKQLVDFQLTQRASIGKVLAPCQNIFNVPPNHTFGKLQTPDNIAECLTHCRINPEREKLSKCLSHLNTIRKCTMRKRFSTPFFKDFYLKIKYFDKCKTGWLPKQTIYDYCKSSQIIFIPSLLEPLLEMFGAFDGEQIRYRTFVDMINHTIPTSDLPKVWDIPEECIDYRTTYTEMVKPGQESNVTPMAGLPSGRYLDLDYPISPAGCCKADRTYLPEESDAKSCLNPSVLTLLGVSHRDMYAQRAADVVKRVFEAAGDKLSHEDFENVWNNAKKKHSQGIVSFESFRQALDEFNNAKITKNV